MSVMHCDGFIWRSAFMITSSRGSCLHGCSLQNRRREGKREVDVERKKRAIALALTHLKNTKTDNTSCAG